MRGAWPSVLAAEPQIHIHPTFHITYIFFSLKSVSSFLTLRDNICGIQGLRIIFNTEARFFLLEIVYQDTGLSIQY